VVAERKNEKEQGCKRNTMRSRRITGKRTFLLKRDERREERGKGKQPVRKQVEDNDC